MEKKTELQKYDLDSPSQLVSMSNTLKKHITSNSLYTTIQGKNYVHVDGWSFAGGILGLFPIVKTVENLSTDTETKWLVSVDIVNKVNGEIVGRGFALCSSQEKTKKSFEEYSILSMAQTRAIGKAYRNLIGWVMKLTGYETTPSEEMDEFVIKRNTKEKPKEPEVKSETKSKIIIYLGVKTEAEAVKIINDTLDLRLTKLPGNEVYLKQLLNQLLLKKNGNGNNSQKTV